MNLPHEAALASREGQLLLACARAVLEPEGRARVRALAGGALDWNFLVRAAEYQGLRPLLYRHLSDCAPDLAPAPLMKEMESWFAANARHSLLLASELGKLLERLEAAGIAALPYKGPVLAATVYGNLALREFFDLDILIEPKHVLSAKTLLLSAGYRPLLEFSPRQEAAYLRSGCEYVFVNSESRVAAEIHWRIGPTALGAEPPVEELLARSQPISLGGSRVRNLCPEDLLVVLSLHAAKHVWRGLSWLCDIAECLRQYPSAHLEGALHNAEQLHLRRLLYLPLLLAHELLQAPVPEGVLAKIGAEPEVGQLVSEVLRRPLLEAAGQEWTTGDHRFFLRARERGRDRLRHLWCFACTPGAAEWSSVQLPDVLFPLYSVVRVARLAGKLLRPASAQAPVQRQQDLPRTTDK